MATAPAKRLKFPLRLLFPHDKPFSGLLIGLLLATDDQTVANHCARRSAEVRARLQCGDAIRGQRRATCEALAGLERLLQTGS